MPTSGESSSVILLGSFQASATNLCKSALNKRCAVYSSCYILGVATSRHQLILAIHELYRCIRQSLSNYCRKISRYSLLSGTRDIHLSQVTSAFIVSPMTPPEARYVTDRDHQFAERAIYPAIIHSLPFRSVETPVAKRPRDATAREPPRSVIEAMVPPWSILSLFV